MTIGVRGEGQSCVHGTTGHCHQCDGVKCWGCESRWPRATGAPWVHVSPEGDRLCTDLEAINAAAKVQQE